jgi:hypothetical protein
MRGFRESYVPGLFEKEGIAVAVAIFLIPFIFLAVFNRILPLHEDASGAAASVSE